MSNILTGSKFKNNLTDDIGYSDICLHLPSDTIQEKVLIGNKSYRRFTNEFWTSKQRQANSIHEISYRACFKAQLPRFFIERFTNRFDTVYDSFSGRGTTIIEAAILNRHVISNDINPLSKILCEPRLSVPDFNEVAQRLIKIPFDYRSKAEIDLSMFYHPDTESEIVSLKNYLLAKEKNDTLDKVDKWIRMVATNRLTGHSKGFFSVYTLPPNQAALPGNQIKINLTRNQKPEYRNVKELILKKSKSLLRNISAELKRQLDEINKNALFLTEDAASTKQIKSNSVQLTVTSPPFLDVVHYSKDNWLRCWFNGIDVKEVEEKITVVNSVSDWSDVMKNVLTELYRITKPSGFVAFEVGEVKSGRVNLDEVIAPVGESVGFNCLGILVNRQKFTKTANIWGVKNNSLGTNSNRIVIFQK